MLIANNNEAERSRLWRIVTTVSSIVIILIAIFFLVRMFTSNPLEGTWKSEDNDLVLEIYGKDSLTANIPEVGEAGNVQVELGCSIDKEEKTIAIRADAEELTRAAEVSGGTYTEENLQNALTNLTTTFSYSVDQQQLTLTEREYGEQMIFEKQ